MFDNEYEVVVADTDFSRSINYHLRYKVYCVETKFEDANKFKNKLEIDEFDEGAEAHFLVRSRRTGEWVAAMRMLKGEGESESLPTLNHSIIEKDINDELTGNMIEISRLCIVSNYRRRKIPNSNITYISGNSALSLQSSRGVEEKSREPEIMLGLLRAAYRYSLNNDINSWLFMITPALARMLDKIGLSIEKVGPTSNFRGKRAPHICDMETFASRLSEKSSTVAAMFERRKAYSEFSKLREEQQEQERKSQYYA